MIQKVEELKDKIIYSKLSETFNAINYPCIYGKISFNRNLMYAGVYKDILSTSIELLADDLKIMSQYLDNQNNKDEMIFNTFIAVFDIDNSSFLFDAIWYEIIRKLHLFDKKEWKKDATKDLGDSEFKFSFDNKLWYPVLITPNHPNKIRQSKITILSFQADQTFIFNKKLANDFHQKKRKQIYKKIDKIYENKRPHYLSEKSKGKYIVQYLGYDFEEDEDFRYPSIILNSFR